MFFWISLAFSMIQQMLDDNHLRNANKNNTIILHLSEQLSLKSLQIITAGKDATKGNSCTGGGNIKWYSQYGKNYRPSSKTKIELSNDPAILLLDICRKNKITNSERYTNLNTHSNTVFNFQYVENSPSIHQQMNG